MGGRDPFYLSQNGRKSDRFSRTLPLANRHGSSRPSIMFTCEGREDRKFNGVEAIDMTNTPPVWYDDREGEEKKRQHHLTDYTNIPTDHLKIFKNFQLQLPSQRR